MTPTTARVATGIASAAVAALAIALMAAPERPVPVVPEPAPTVALPGVLPDAPAVVMQDGGYSCAVGYALCNLTKKCVDPMSGECG